MERLTVLEAEGECFSDVFIRGGEEIRLVAKDIPVLDPGVGFPVEGAGRVVWQLKV